MTAQFGDRKKLTSRIVWTLLALFVLGGGALLLWKPLLYLAYFAATGGNTSMTKAVDNRPLGYFYRFTANYSHKGEPLNFDYVVACNIRVTSYRGGGTSNDSTYTPKVMMMPTSDGGAIMVRTINACKGETTANGKVPEDLFPMAIWFDDVNDMTFGWGYATEDAYDSELSQLEFLGAKIEVSDRGRWEAWRKASAEGFQAVGMIKTPWGRDLNESWYGRRMDKTYDTSKRLIARNCEGYSRIKLPENIRAEIKLLWPADRPRYWAPSPKVKLRSIFDRGIYPEGHKYKHYLSNLTSGLTGLPLREGKGNLRPFVEVVTDVYPLLPRSRSLPNALREPAKTYPRRVVFDGGRMKGFLACGGDAPYDSFIERFDPDVGTKKHPVFVDDYLVKKQVRSPELPIHIFENDEFVFKKGPAGRGAP